MARSEALLADRPLDRDPARSLTLPSHLYTSPEAFAREREAIFFRNWHLAGHVSDLPEAGSYITTAIHDQNVFICRGKDGAAARLLQRLRRIGPMSCSRAPAGPRSSPAPIMPGPII